MTYSPPKLPAAAKTPLEYLITRKDTTKVLRVCLRTVDSYIASGALAVVKLGSATRIDPADLRAFIESQKTRAGTQQ